MKMDAVSSSATTAQSWKLRFARPVLTLASTNFRPTTNSGRLLTDRYTCPRDLERKKLGVLSALNQV